MNRWVLRIVVTLVLASAVHVLAIRQTPHIVAARLEKMILEMGEVNSFKHSDPNSAGPENKIPMSNPDFLPSILVYDVSEKPLRIHLAIPGNVPYWSFSLFADNIDNYYVLNDRDEGVVALIDGMKEKDLVLVGPGKSYQGSADEIVVSSPTETGFGLIRMIVVDRYSEKGLERVKKLKKIQLMSRTEPM